MKRTAINITRAYSMAVVALLSLLSGVVTAQSLYDDDLYGNPGKKSSKEVKQEAPAEAVYVYESPVAVRAEQSLSTVSVDEYNRRGFFAVDETVADSVATEEAETLGDFAYTRRIEAFHNPDVVAASGDEELAQMYYATPANITINVVSPDYYWWNSPYYGYYNFYSPWYRHAWGWGYYDYWYPGWGWSWAWGPSWSHWGWDHYWGIGHYHPGWGWGHSWAFGHHHHYYPGGGGGIHPGGSHNGTTTRPGHGNGYRPGVTGRTDRLSAGRQLGTGNYRPGAAGTRQPNTTVRGTGTPSRQTSVGEQRIERGTGVTSRPASGRAVSPVKTNPVATPTQTTRPSTTTTPSRTTTTPSRSTSTPSRSSFGSSGSGFRSSGGSGGGGRSSGGGGGRGGRR